MFWWHLWKTIFRFLLFFFLEKWSILFTQNINKFDKNKSPEMAKKIHPKKCAMFWSQWKKKQFFDLCDFYFFWIFWKSFWIRPGPECTTKVNTKSIVTQKTRNCTQKNHKNSQIPFRILRIFFFSHIGSFPTEDIQSQLPPTLRSGLMFMKVAYSAESNEK